MKAQSTLFALFLVASTFLSTHAWAQTASIQPATEQKASQEAYQFGEETRSNELRTSQLQKGENHSTNAMHWKFIRVNQDAPLTPARSGKPTTLKKLQYRKISYADGPGKHL